MCPANQISSKETVHVGEAQVKSIAEFMQQAIGIEFTHHEFHNFEDPASDCNQF